ncbi:Uma2 family endonuclease [Ornithinimicrobium sp. F0845]|uniref:Uma2 family endonuclease n=1 Tax=Ornithinimicrobium sp. F0845 TaxID=2926412 RepID=UPI001FF4CC9C|nr:Uma2 family endonuclease [Ornithinimicrobium sp. F0845]MCK0111339.1 Uma2 family endonuclease [Ornithinimicrobium sp. F0845]
MTDLIQMPHGRVFTAADLEAMPDDGNRYEIIDGALIVTPSPAVPHQRVVGNMYLALRSAVPDDLEVMLAPLDVTVSDLTVLQPDLLVATREALSGRTMVGLPVLAIEVLSPSTRLIDLNLKKAAFAEAGVAHYWVIDPEHPSLTAWCLSAAEFTEVGTATGTQEFAVDEPFRVRVSPASLLR